MLFRSVGSLQWDQLQEVPLSEEVGETLRSLKSWRSLSSIQSQLHVLPSGGLMRIRRQRGRQAKGKLMKVSWTNSSRKSVETGSSGSLKRVRSPTPLEYALDHLILSLSRVPQEDRPSHEESPNYSPTPSNHPRYIFLARCWGYVKFHVKGFFGP